MQDIGATSNPKTLNTLWKKIWSINSPRVVKMFLWKTCSNILPTKENLYKRKIANDPLYVICGREAETIGHVLWNRSMANDVWMDSSRKI